MPVLSKYPHRPSKLGPKWKQTAEKQKTHVEQYIGSGQLLKWQLNNL